MAINSIIEKETESQPVIQTRRAEKSDLERLVQISKTCFPEELRWHGPKAHVLRWWEHILNADYSEIWVCTVRDRVVGFINLVQDIDRHFRERREFNGGIKVGLYLLTHYPVHTWRYIIKQVSQGILLLIKRNKCTLTGVTNNDGPIIWIRPVAVERSMQGIGLGTELIMTGVRRAHELGYNRIRLGVDRFNTKAIDLYQRLQFKYIGSMADYLFFERETNGVQRAEQEG